jgi:gas vesicle protein
MAEDRGYSALGWFVAGLGLGALVGILFAPKSGRETREDLITSAREGSEYLREKARVAAEQVGSVVERGKAQASELYEKGRDQWGDLLDRGKGFVNEKATRVGAAVEAGREAYYSTTKNEG